MIWRYILHQWIYYSGWTNLFALIRFSGWDKMDQVIDQGGVSLPESLAIANLGAFILGALTALFEVRKRRLFKSQLLWRNINLIRITVFLVVLLFSSLISCFIIISLEEIWSANQILPRYMEVISSSAFRIVNLFLAIVVIINVALLSFMDWHGSATFTSILTGKVYITNRENRVFLFIDLNSSTDISSKIGYKKYSQLIETCFDELRTLARKYESEIYEYVGDEMILTWLSTKAFNKNACIQLFLDFKSVLNARSKEFESRFGVIPSFKAAVSMGDVLSSVSGSAQKRKAFYGQPLHQTSRMLGIGKKYGRDFVCTQAIQQEAKSKKNCIRLHRE